MKTQNDIRLSHYTAAEEAIESADSATSIIREAIAAKDYETAKAAQEGQKLELLSGIVHAILALPNDVVDDLVTEIP